MCRDLKALREGGKIGDLRMRTGFLGILYYVYYTYHKESQNDTVNCFVLQH